MKLPFVIVKRSVWEDKRKYGIYLEDEVVRLKSELVSKTNVLAGVNAGVRIIKEQAIREGVEAGKTYMKRELIRHVRTKQR